MSRAPIICKAPSVEASSDQQAHVARWLGRLVRRLFPRRHKWQEKQLQSLDGKLIYTVRDCAACSTREILSRGGWHDPATVKYSCLPSYEDWHREQYLNAVPRKPNTELGRAERRP